jgi:hypothetical protein
MHKKLVLQDDLLAAYRDMAREEKRETEALAWAEATAGDVARSGSSRSSADSPRTR